MVVISKRQENVPENEKNINKNNSKLFGDIEEIDQLSRWPHQPINLSNKTFRPRTPVYIKTY